MITLLVFYGNGRHSCCSAQLTFILVERLILIIICINFVTFVMQLRLLYECDPMAYIIEQAGGKAHSGVKPILDIQPTSIHERAPIFIGSKEDVDDYLKIREKYQKK